MLLVVTLTSCSTSNCHIAKLGVNPRVFIRYNALATTSRGNAFTLRRLLVDQHTTTKVSVEQECLAKDKYYHDWVFSLQIWTFFAVDGLSSKRRVASNIFAFLITLRLQHRALDGTRWDRPSAVCVQEETANWTVRTISSTLSPNLKSACLA